MKPIIKRFEQFQDMYSNLFPPKDKKEGVNYLPRTVTFQVTNACNLACTYCYQINKNKKRMPWEVAKQFCDYLLNSTEENNDYINPTISPAIIIDFIGGEPLLEIDLIEKIMDYWMEKTIEMNHPWAMATKFSICSNGVLYFDEKFQRLLKKHGRNLSFSISIDGNKKLHDSCRIFPDGKPSYDIAISGVDHYMNELGGYMGSKMTLAKENIMYTSEAIISLFEHGYTEVLGNCVYEAEWTKEDAKIFYKELIKLSDYILSQDNYEELYCSLFESQFFHPKEETDIQNWCGGTGMMLSCDADGFLYPCIRYTETSLSKDQPALFIGTVWGGIGKTDIEKEHLKLINGIDRRTQSTDECFYCPIAEGCSWCSAYNYQSTGSVNKRVTKICIMHKARALANAYHWNNYYRKINSIDRFKIYIPDEWALEIIDQEELNKLKELEKP